MKKIFSLILMFLFVFVLVSCDDLGSNNNNDKKEDENEEEEEEITLRDKNPKYDIYYSIFVRSFADSDDDGIGDLRGIINNLDYFEELGVTALILLPVHTTDTDFASVHGYRIKDYYDINPEYGTLEDYQDLIAELHKRDMRLVLDLVINHTSDQHPWLSDEDYYDYYLRNSNGQTTGGIFGGHFAILDKKNIDVEREIYKIVKFYLDMGVDGFRFDAAQHFFDEDNTVPSNNKLFESSRFIQKIKNYAVNINPDVFFVSEVFNYSYNHYAQFYLGNDSVFDFYTADQLWSQYGNGRTNNLLKNIQSAYSAYESYNENYIPSLFLSNHDIERLAGWGQFQGENGLLKLKQVASILYTLPGSPHIYYGEELGMIGNRYEEWTNSAGQTPIYDHYIRAPFLWGTIENQTTWLADDGSNNNTQPFEIQKNNSNSLYNHYKTLMNLRKNNPALMYGNSFELWSGNTQTLQGIIRTYDDGDVSQKVLVIHNMSSNSVLVNEPYLKVLFGSINLGAFQTVVLEIE